jgi:AAA domain/Primase C terminal 2 (PriCT-2)
MTRADGSIATQAEASTPGLVALVPALRNAGYGDLHPIIPPAARLSANSKLSPKLLGKTPGRYRANDGGVWSSYNWAANLLGDNDLLFSLRHGAGLGTLTRDLPFLDCDVNDQDLAGCIEATVRATLGATASPKRIGRAPRWAMPFRHGGAPFHKVVLTFARGSETLGKLECLGVGNQIVLAGTHPSGVAYAWENGRAGGVEILSECPAASLPVISPTIITETLLPALEAQLAPYGVTATLGGGGSATAGPAPDQDSLLAPSLSDLRALIEQLPNETEYDDYISVGRMVRGACGEGNAGDGLEIWQAWCVRAERGENHPDLNAEKWASFRPPHHRGWDALQSFARGHGVNTGAYAFEADPTAAPPPVREPVEPLPTSGERIAALLGDAMPSLFLEVTTLRGAELRRRWQTLEAATHAADPLHGFFHSTVLPLADRYRERTLGQFRLLLLSDLRQNARWCQLAATDQEILLSAGWAFAVPFDTLMARSGLVPEVDIFGPQPARAWVVERSIPAESVGVVFGSPKARKTYVVTDLAARIATGCPFRQRPVQRGGVLYFASESIPQISERLRAWATVNGDCRANFKLIPRAFPILDPAEALREVTLRHQFPSNDPLRLVVVDVLRSSITDENSNEVMADAVATAQLIARAFDVTVILVHHSPRVDAKRTSGGNALDGGVDWGWGVEKKDEKSTVTVRMSRGEDEGDEWSVRVENGVLQELGAAEPAWMDVYSESEAANEAGRAGHRLGKGATKDAIKSLVREERPTWFSSPVVHSNTAKNRANLALVNAEKAGYVVRAGEHFNPGTTTPPPREFGVLEALLGAATGGPGELVAS